MLFVNYFLKKMTDTLFQKIVNKEIPANIVYQDELVTAFSDIAPQAPIHILIVPNKIIATANDIGTEQEQIAGRMLSVAAKIAKEKKIAQDGYRLIINCNKHGRQEVYHLHLHLVGGKQLGKILP